MAAFLFPGRAADQIDTAGYRQILETADTLCRELGYQSVVKLTPPTVPFSDAGLYWTTPPHPTAPPAGATEAETVIIAGPGRVAMLAEGLLLDAQLFTLFAWAYAEWPRAQGQPFLLPLQRHAAQFDTYREQPWPRGQTEA